jgi:hypothetical protein
VHVTQCSPSAHQGRARRGPPPGLGAQPRAARMIAVIVRIAPIWQEEWNFPGAEGESWH